MIYDDVSIFILENILDSAKKHSEISTWQMAKSFRWKDKKEGMSPSQRDDFYIKKTAFINKRLDKMSGEGFVKIERNSRKKVYTILDNKIIKKNYKFPDGTKKALLIKEKSSNKWIILEI